jgi:hypothetical protein
MCEVSDENRTTEQLEALVDAHRVIMAVAIDQFDAARKLLEKARKRGDQHGQ